MIRSTIIYQCDELITVESLFSSDIYLKTINLLESNFTKYAWTKFYVYNIQDTCINNVAVKYKYIMFMEHNIFIFDYHINN